MFESLDKRWIQLQEYFSIEKIKYPMSEFFTDMVTFLNGYEEYIKEMRKKDEKPKVIERKPLQPIQSRVEQPSSLCDNTEDVDEFIKNMARGIYRGRTPRSATPRASESKTTKKVDSIKQQRESVGCRVRRIGQPTLIVGPTNPNVHTTRDENSGIPDTDTLVEQLKLL